MILFTYLLSFSFFCLTDDSIHKDYKGRYYCVWVFQLHVSVSQSAWGASLRHLQFFVLLCSTFVESILFFNHYRIPYLNELLPLIFTLFCLSSMNWISCFPSLFLLSFSTMEIGSRIFVITLLSNYNLLLIYRTGLLILCSRIPWKHARTNLYKSYHIFHHFLFLSSPLTRSDRALSWWLDQRLDLVVNSDVVKDVRRHPFSLFSYFCMLAVGFA